MLFLKYSIVVSKTEDQYKYFTNLKHCTLNQPLPYPILVYIPIYVYCRLCAKTVLNIKWQQLEDEELKSKQNLRATVEATHSQLQLAGFDRFGLLLPLMDDPWTDPVLSQIMAGEDTESDEGL